MLFSTHSVQIKFILLQRVFLKSGQIEIDLHIKLPAILYVLWNLSILKRYKQSLKRIRQETAKAELQKS